MREKKNREKKRTRDFDLRPRADGRVYRGLY